MSYGITESSVESGQPIELYTWDLGTEVVRQCNWHQNLTIGGVVYTAEKISRQKVKASNDQEIAALDVNTTIANSVVERFALIPPGSRVQLTIEQTHLSEIGGTEERQRIYIGLVSTVRFSGLQNATVRCKPATTVFLHVAPRIKYTILCGHVLYDERCKVNRASFSYTGTVTAVGSSTITVNGASGEGADFFEGGYAEFPAGIGDDYRMITEQSGDVMTLLLPFAEDVNGLQVQLFAGCKHDLTTCNSKFSNAVNYGGFPYIPKQNPFESELR